MNDTHNPALRSWVESANDASSDFPIQNLPFGVFSNGGERRCGVAIGDRIVDVSAVADSFTGGAADIARACSAPVLNSVMAESNANLSEFRAQLSSLLSSDSASRTALEKALVPMADATLHLPADVGDYTDFYASIYHATNVGKLFRPDNPLLPNYKHVPIGYHGRASSLIPTGAEIARPSGQTHPSEKDPPKFGPSAGLDYEAEVGFFVGTPNRLGTAIPIDEAANHIFGFCLVNDWSARDIQSWEYQPLGPFLAKNFATTVSPWVVTREAIEPFRVPAFFRPADDPKPLPYLSSEEDEKAGGLDLTIEVFIRTSIMREGGLRPTRISVASFSDMYWTTAQMLAHHASGGCNLRTGDLLASGTVSGPEEGMQGCLLEITRRGANPLQLSSGEERKFLHDGDEIILRGYFERDGCARIGMGECSGRVVAHYSS
ncbi:MAG: fumarylacetoacetase [Gemmatimonadaceae bacterium]|nr:fumarylacetoacetase [Gemmatimonadaceae bacterium]